MNTPEQCCQVEQTCPAQSLLKTSPLEEFRHRYAHLLFFSSSFKVLGLNLDLDITSKFIPLPAMQTLSDSWQHDTFTEVEWARSRLPDILSQYAPLRPLRCCFFQLPFWQKHILNFILQLLPVPLAHFDRKMQNLPSTTPYWPHPYPFCPLLFECYLSWPPPLLYFLVPVSSLSLPDLTEEKSWGRIPSESSAKC